jgi:predicted Zn-dependent protease
MRLEGSFLRRLTPVLVLAGCAVNPATGERQFSLVGEAQEIEMGREADQGIVAGMGLVDDDDLQRYVSEIGTRLAAASERPDLPWTFRVLDDPTVNAFALPGGFIYVTRGILTHLTSEAELAGVLGHEIGHVTARHSVEQMSRARLAQLGLGIGMIFSETVRDFGDVAGASLGLLFLKFGRDDESQADRLGVRYMTREAYDPRELAGVMRMLARTSEMRSGSGRVPEWLATHPDPVNRDAAIHDMVASSAVDLSNAVVARAAYLRRVDGLTFGADPREGFVDADVFHHPELAFRIDVASGWQVANGKTEVQFVSPEQDGAVLLTLGEGAPAAALADFGDQEGLRLGAVSRARVNGLEAASAPFEATTEQGVLSGEALFLSYAGGTYRLLGLSSQAGWPALRPAARGVMRSFREETDLRVLAVQPDRLGLVSLDAPLPFGRFVERYPSPVTVEVIALINQIETSSILPRGLAKRVVGGN